MTSTLPRRTAAVTALAVAAFSGVALAGAAVSASASPRAHTSLSIRAATASINPGGGDFISGNLNSPKGHVAGRWIHLLAKPNGSTTWSQLKMHRTAFRGHVGFQVTPTVSTRYRLAFDGNKFQRGSQSGVVSVRVRNTTSLTIAVSATSIAPGASDTVSGVLSLGGTPLAGDTVKLLGRHNPHGFAKLASATTAVDGSVSFTVTPAVTTQYVLVFNKTSTAGYARSAVATVHVLRPSSLSIRAKANVKKGVEIISGNLRGAGHALAHRKVILQDMPAGGSSWTTVATHRTNHNGGVAFTEPAPTSNENYQLVFAGGGLFDGCQSGVVTVNVS
jgi:hypothetical protein